MWHSMLAVQIPSESNGDIPGMRAQRSALDPAPESVAASR